MESSGDIQEDNVSEQDSTTGLLHSITHPSGFIFKSIGLSLLCFIGFGSYFCYDNPAALQDHIKKDLDLTEAQYTMLYTVYSAPNVILGFIGGFLIDRVFGIRLACNLYMGLTLIGQLCFATGVWMDCYWLALVGRAIFGIGAEPLSVVQNNYAVAWFKGKVLNMVFGLQLSFARVGSTVNSWVMEYIYEWVTNNFAQGFDGLAITLYIATLTCVFSFLCSLLMGYMDKKTERVLGLPHTVECDPVKLSDIKYFNGKFWLLSAIIIFYYVSIFPFFAIGKSFFMDKFDMDEKTANFICGLVYLIAGITSPIFGFIIDKTGRNLVWVIIGILLTTAAHYCLQFLTSLNPYISMTCMGFSYSILASSLWPLVSLVIPEHQLGTAYGVCSALQNSGLALGTAAVGHIIESYGYTGAEIFFLSCLLVALLSALVLIIWDILQKDILNMSPAARIRRQQRLLAAQILEREKLNVQSSQGSYDEFGQPSDFYIRNRYLSRIGAKLPSSYNPAARGLTFLR